MNNSILKLDAPYNIIYAGGRIGRHIATMTVWDDTEFGIFEASQYPMIDEGGELAAGALITEATLGDCRVVCNERDPHVGLRALAEIVKYDLEQEEPVEFAYLWERLSLLGVKVVWDKARDEKGERSYVSSGFYFYARGSVEEVYKELHYQHMIYESCFDKDALLIKFETPDGWEQHFIDLLNSRKEYYEPAPDEDKLI